MEHGQGDAREQVRKQIVPDVVVTQPGRDGEASQQPGLEAPPLPLASQRVSKSRHKSTLRGGPLLGELGVETVLGDPVPGPCRGVSRRTASGHGAAAGRGTLQLARTPTGPALPWLLGRNDAYGRRAAARVIAWGHGELTGKAAVGGDHYWWRTFVHFPRAVERVLQHALTLSPLCLSLPLAYLAVDRRGRLE